MDETWIVGMWECRRILPSPELDLEDSFGWIRGSWNMGSKTCLPMAWYKTSSNLVSRTVRPYTSPREQQHQRHQQHFLIFIHVSKQHTLTSPHGWIAIRPVSFRQRISTIPKQETVFLFRRRYFPGWPVCITLESTESKGIFP
jgi:hypothetical protein